MSNKVSGTVSSMFVEPCIGGDLGLSLTGMRIAPRDPATHVAKVGLKNEVVKAEAQLAQMQALILKV